MYPLLSIQNLSVDFVSEAGNVTALNNISFSINNGEILAIVGESGSGKSVTALSILRLLPSPPANYLSGQILFSATGTEQTNLLKSNIRSLLKIRGNKIAMIFQEPMSSLNPVLTCGTQVMEALQIHKKISKAAAKQKTIEWFEMTKLPDPDFVFNSYPHQLSGGQKQRVMIAMAMCCEPRLLICDEPTTALDVSVQKSILQLIKDLQQQLPIGVIFITHDLGVVAEIADRTIVMYKGEIVEENTVKNIFTNPQHPYTKALLACRPVIHEKGKRLPIVSDFLQSESLIETQQKKTTPQNFEPPTSNLHPPTSNIQPPPSTLQPSTSNFQQPPASPASRGIAVTTSNIKTRTEPYLQVQNLSVWFPSKKTFFGSPRSYIKAVDDVSFEIIEGETMGLVGESGCGKTTLGRTLLRLIEPTAGKILFNGTDLAATKKKDLGLLRKEIQIVFQDPYSSLNPRLTIGSAIAEPLKVHGLFENDKTRKQKVVELLEKVDLRPEHFNRYPHEFSGGQRQRIVIARALALNPSFIVCDECVSALDVSVQAQVLNLLNELKREFGFTIIFISHDLSVVRYISDRIMVMNKGKIVETGFADEIYRNPKSSYTQKLIAAIPGGIPSISS